MLPEATIVCNAKSRTGSIVRVVMLGFAMKRYATDYDKTIELPDGVREDVC